MPENLSTNDVLHPLKTLSQGAPDFPNCSACKYSLSVKALSWSTVDEGLYYEVF